MNAHQRGDRPSLTRVVREPFGCPIAIIAGGR
jgi:hypothetical protein